ncbi:MAG: alpha/beta hydrolase [Lacisediminihabitans sp.]
MAERVFEPEGRAVPYVEEGDGPVSLVLIADLALDSDRLGVVAHYLAKEAGFHVVRVGPSGESKEAELPVDERAGERVDDTLAVIDHLGLDHTWIGGHGSGGTLARRFAAEHVERVNGLLLLGVEDEPIPLAPVIPVLIIQAMDDATTPPANGEKLQELAPERVSITSIDGADHLFPVTHPMETAVIIEEYLDWD